MSFRLAAIYFVTLLEFDRVGRTSSLKTYRRIDQQFRNSHTRGDRDVLLRAFFECRCLQAFSIRFCWRACGARAVLCVCVPTISSKHHHKHCQHFNTNGTRSRTRAGEVTGAISDVISDGSPRSPVTPGLPPDLTDCVSFRIQKVSVQVATRYCSAVKCVVQ